MTEHSLEQVKEWLDRIYLNEGGFTDNRKDRGNWTSGIIGVGELKGTNHGISAAQYPDLDIKNLTRLQAAQIYIDDYLKPIKANRFRDGVAYQMLDIAVISGPPRAKFLLQEAIKVTADGHVGPITLAKMAGMSESDLIMLITARHIRFLVSLGSFDTFGGGWMVRKARNLEFGAEDS